MGPGGVRRLILSVIFDLKLHRRDAAIRTGGGDQHARVAMLAALGYPVAEVFHPLWGGSINEPSLIAFQATPLQTFWPIVVGAIGLIESASCNVPAGNQRCSLLRGGRAPPRFTSTRHPARWRGDAISVHGVTQQ